MPCEELAIRWRYSRSVLVRGRVLHVHQLGHLSPVWISYKYNATLALHKLRSVAYRSVVACAHCWGTTTLPNLDERPRSLLRTYRT